MHKLIDRSTPADSGSRYLEPFKPRRESGFIHSSSNNLLEPSKFALRQPRTPVNQDLSCQWTCVAKDELLDGTPTSVVGGGSEVDAVVEMLDSDEFAELIWPSRASRSTRSTERNLSYVAWTAAKSFLISSNPAYARFRTKLKTDLHREFLRRMDSRWDYLDGFASIPAFRILKASSFCQCRLSRCMPYTFIGHDYPAM